MAGLLPKNLSSASSGQNGTKWQLQRDGRKEGRLVEVGVGAVG